MTPRGAPADRFPRRGEIYLVRLDKDRQAVVISADALNRYAFDVCVVPITSVERPRFSLRVPLQSAKPPQMRFLAKCDQVTMLDKTLLRYPPLGPLNDEALKAIEQAIKRALQLPYQLDRV